MTVVAAAPVDEVAAIVFVDVAIIVVVARLVGALFRQLRQPPVVGEIIGGIALGPSVLGLLPGDLPGLVFPVEARPFLGIIAQLGLIIFMFIVGLELDLGLIKGNERTAATISIASVALPFGLGVLLARLLYPLHVEVPGFPPVRFLPFALFLGAAMSITAFPVLARILTDRGMHRTQIGALTLACAAVDDIIAWSLLAVVIAIAQASGLTALPAILLETLAFVAVMFTVVRRLLARLADRYRRDGMTPEILAAILVGVLLSSFVTDRIGIHSIFGAFVFGTVMPRRDTGPLFRDVLERLEHMTVLLLLPVFFVATGLNVDVGGLGMDALPQLGAILLVAIAGKFVGATVAARTRGLRLQRAAAIGVLMNTRGLTGFVILNVGVSIGVLDQRMFTMMVLMAVITTVMTEPLLRLVYPNDELARDVAEAQRSALDVVEAYRILVAVDDPADAARLCAVAVAAIGDERPAGIVLGRFNAHGASEQRGGYLAAKLAASAQANATLSRLAETVRTSGIDAVVQSWPSSDVAGDLLAQAVAVEADLVLIGAEHGGGKPLIEWLRRDAPCDVVTLWDPARTGLSPDAGQPVVIAAGTSVHDDAAGALGRRIARGLSSDARLLGGAHGSRGLDAALRRHAADGALLVVGLRTAGSTVPVPAPMLIVSARDGGSTTWYDGAAPGMIRAAVEETRSS